jgi:hypothetical protein
VRWYRVNNQPGQPRPASLCRSWAVQVQRNSARPIRVSRDFPEARLCDSGARDCRAIGGQAAAATLGSASFAAKKRCPKLAPSVPL